MHLALFRREAFSSDDPSLIGRAAGDQFARTHNALQTWSEVEHDDDGRHTNISAQTIAVTGAATFSDVTATGDVTAQAGTPNVSALGVLSTVLPAEGAKQALLLGEAGIVIERRPQAFPPFPDPTAGELVIWNLKHSTIVPIVRVGIMSGEPTLIDGGTGSVLNLGHTLRPIAAIVASVIRSGALGYFERSRFTALGEWQAQAFSGGDFTASDGQAWTVGAATRTFMLAGKTLFLNFQIDGSTVSGACVRLFMALPPGVTITAAANAPVTFLNGVTGTGYIEATPTRPTQVACIKDINGTAWVGGTTFVRGQIAIDVAGV